MKLEQLKYLLYTYRKGSMNKAAKELFISQPAISASIRQLEDELNTKLVNFSHNTMTFTDAGMVVIQATEEIMDRISRMKTEVAQVKDRQSNILFGYSTASSIRMIPALISILPKFNSIYPNVNVELVEGTFKEQYSSLDDRKITLLFGKNSKIMGDRYNYLSLFMSPLCAYVGNNHQLAKNKTVSIKDIANETLLTFLPIWSSTNRQIEEIAERAGYQIKLQYYSQISVLNDLIKKGLGVVVIPRIYIYNFDAVELVIDDAEVFDYGIFYSRKRTLTDEEKVLIDMLQEAANDLN